MAGTGKWGSSVADFQSLIINYLDVAKVMHLATAGSDGPWGTTMYFAVDNLHNIYWLSDPTARHSRNIAQSGWVAGSISLPQQYSQPWRGLQFEGEAKEIPLKETAGLFQAYAERFTAHQRLQYILSGTDAFRLYRCKPTNIVLCDEQIFPGEPQKVWQLVEGQPVTTSDERPVQEALLIEEEPAPKDDVPSPHDEGPQTPPVIPADNPRPF